MSRSGIGRAWVLVAAITLGAVLLLSCQPAQPVATPKAGETPAQKAAVTASPAKTPEKAAETPVRGGILRISSTTDPNSLDPPTVTACGVCNSMYDLLIEPDADGNVTKEGLFKDWTVSADGKAITFKLQSGVKFHDGTDLDAAAVKFNIERMKDPATKSPYASNYAAVTSMDVVDSLTIRFNLSRPDPILLARMGTQGGMMVSPAAVQRLGQDLARKPVGSGPFQFVEWVPGDHLTVKGFDGYWRKGQPYLDQAYYKIITDATVGFANLRTGQVDVYTPPSGGLPPEQLPTLKATADLTYLSRVSTTLGGMYLNTKRAPFDNKAVRQAVALVVDKEGQAAVYGELAYPYASLYHPANWGSDPVKGVFPARDLAKAKAKMAEAGYPSGGLKVKLLSGDATPTVRRSEVLKANLAQIGIEADIEVVSQVVWLSRAAVVGGDYQITVWNTGIQLADPGHIFELHYHSKGGRNYFGPYSNPKVDELLEKAGSIYDQKERTALYLEMAQLVVDDAPFISTHMVNTITPMTKKVRGYPVSQTSTVGLRGTWMTK